MKRLVAALLLASLVSITACTSMDPLSGAEEPEPVKKVKVYEVTSMSMGVPVKVDAGVVASSRIEIASETSGKMIRKLVETGDAVEKGQLLFELDQTEFKAALERAKLAKERVLLELENSKIELRENNNTRIDLLKINLKEAELSIAEASRNLQRTRITSPVSGIVTDLSGLSEGQQVSPGGRLVLIERLDPLHITAAITEKDMLEIREKEQMPVYFPVLDRTLNADILYISPSAGSSPQSGFTLQAKIANRDGELRPGMSAQVILDDSMAQKTIAVPVAAVLKEDGKSYVYTLSGQSTVNKKHVEVGRKNIDHAEIVSGLAEGDTIVIVGQSLLSDGDAVQVVD
ncbi:efflux RND transporter periplasmic adaptor subunit [Paenibacillus tarimensis]